MELDEFRNSWELLKITLWGRQAQLLQAWGLTYKKPLALTMETNLTSWEKLSTRISLIIKGT